MNLNRFNPDAEILSEALGFNSFNAYITAIISAVETVKAQPTNYRELMDEDELVALWDVIAKLISIEDSTIIHLFGKSQSEACKASAAVGFPNLEFYTDKLSSDMLDRIVAQAKEALKEENGKDLS